MLGVLIALGGCHKESKSATSPATPKASVATPAVTQTTRPAQETAFIRECLAVGLRPTLLLELESKAIAEAQGQAKAGGPTKAQLKDLRDSFSAAAAKLNEMAASPEATAVAARRSTLPSSRSSWSTP